MSLLASCKSFFWPQEPSTYRLGQYCFLRGLGILYCIAFVSLWTQAMGLFGESGIFPTSLYLDAIAKNAADTETNIYFKVPTFLWISSSDFAIHCVFTIGILAALMLAAGLVGPLALFICWTCYLSFTQGVYQFLNYQWDILLLETGFAALLLTPWVWIDAPKQHLHKSSLKIGRWLIAWLLFRLMFESGIVKLNSFGAEGQNRWLDLTALNYHYFTQPIPHTFSWYFHHMPQWVHSISLWSMFIIELVLPFCVFLRGIPRTLGLALQIALQLIIMASGNFGFFNILTILLCVPLFADQSLPNPFKKRIASTETAPTNFTRLNIFSHSLKGLIALFLVFISSLQLFHTLKWIDLYGRNEEKPQVPDFIHKITGSIAPYYLVNAYGLFRVMTEDRPEIVISGSQDGKEWKPYKFKWKPTSTEKMPGICIPHMPRLDWQMWFAALIYHSSGNFRPWFGHFIQKLKQNDPAVLSLLEETPYPNASPKYLRIELYLYTYTSIDENKATEQHWNRKRLNNYTKHLVTD